jgi:small-conductance mechanosensitive channel
MVVGIFAAGALIARSNVGDRLARGLPLALLVGFQGFRLPLELAMHRAYSEGLMPIQMSYSGRNFDVISGITAIVLGIALSVTSVPRRLIQAWNLLGLILLFNILGVAIASTPMFAYFGPDRLNVWVMWMPYTLLPAVRVLAAWAGHLIVWRALSLRAASTPDLR